MSRDNTRDRRPDASSVPAADPAKEPAAASPPAEPAARPQAPALAKGDDDGALLRRAEQVITYLWGEAPPFKDLADLLADIRASLQRRASSKA